MQLDTSATRRRATRRKVGLATLLVLFAAVSALPAAGRELTSAYVITAAANLQGKNGTDWHSDLTLHNPHSYTLPVVLQFLQNGRSNLSSVPTVEFDLYAYETLNLWDVLGPDGFNARGRKGALLVYADDSRITCQGTACDFAAFSRTYTLATGGTGEYGQAIPGVPAALGLDYSVAAYMPQISVDRDFRTNLGLASWTDANVWVRVEIQNPNGDIIARSDHLVLPYGHADWGLTTSVTGGTAVMYILSGPGDAMVYPYASVVENRTGDGVNIEAWMTPVGLTAQAKTTRAPRRELRREHAPERQDVPSFSVERLRRHSR